jgi:hypothetical protein
VTSDGGEEEQTTFANGRLVRPLCTCNRRAPAAKKNTQPLPEPACPDPVYSKANPALPDFVPHIRIQTVVKRNLDFLEERVSFSRRLQVVIFGLFQQVLLLKMLQIVVGSEAIKIFGTRRSFPLGAYFLFPTEHSAEAADT